MFQHQVVSGLFWWAGRYLGWVGHFRVLQFLNSSRAGWGPEKRPFIVLCSSDPKKGPFAALRTFPPRTPGCSVLPSLELQCTVALAPGICRSQHFEHYSNTLTLSCLHVWAIINISSHYIIHSLPDTIFNAWIPYYQCLLKCFSEYSWVVLFLHGERYSI